MTDYNPEDDLFYVEKFEWMLKTNEIYFFEEVDFIGIIIHYLDEGKDNLVNQAIKLGLIQHPNSFELKLLKAEQLNDEDNTDVAIFLLEELFKIEPKDYRLFLLRAEIFSKKFQHKKAIQMLREALKYTHDENEIHYLIGMQLMYQEEYKEAEKYFINALEIDINDYRALNNLMFCYETQKKYANAQIFLLEYIEQNPYSELAWFHLGKQYYAQKNYREAIKAFDYALLIEDDFVGAFIEKGKALEKLKKYDEAIENYTTTLNLEDPTAFIYFKIGKCYERINLVENAVIFHKKAIHEDPQFEKSWLALMKLFIQKKQYQEALLIVENAIEIDEYNLKFLKNKTKILQYLSSK
ncbi:MAG: tetratricopeptide repeat protein, partial [Flavobacteriaceae bacterium]|nr:tetratricopeptide repeat protein [Flavobacteriaceae bacterium]